MAVGARGLPGVLGFGALWHVCSRCGRVREHELVAGGMAHGAVRTAIDVLGLVALGALRGRHVVATRALDGHVSRQVGLAAVDDGRLGGVECRLSGRGVDAGLLEGCHAHVVSDRGVAHHALAALGVLGVREPGGGELHVGMTANAPFAWHGCGGTLREGVVARDVSGDLLQRDDLVLHSRDGAVVHVALDAGDVPCGPPSSTPSGTGPSRGTPSRRMPAGRWPWRCRRTRFPARWQQRRGLRSAGSAVDVGQGLRWLV